MTYRYRYRYGPFVLAAVLGAAACGNLTPGGFHGEATVVVSGNYPAAPAPSPTPQMSLAPGWPVTPASHEPDEADEAEGVVEVEFMVFLVSEGGSRVRVGDDELRVKVDLQGVEEAPVVTDRVPALVYRQLRLLFTEIRVEVEGGLVINGQPVVGELHVELQHLSVPVERPIVLDIQDGQSVELVVDLNAPAWLTAVDPATRTIDESIFADLVHVVVRSP